jgi:hypothetical protein
MPDVSRVWRAGAGWRSGVQSIGYEFSVLRIWIIAAGLALAGFTALGVSAALRPPITQAASGKTFRLAKGETATLRLSNRWHWSQPRTSTNAVELTRVDYFTDPGFGEWLVKARARGEAVIRSVGKPNCSDCELAVRHFRVTILVGSR